MRLSNSSHRRLRELAKAIEANSNSPRFTEDRRSSRVLGSYREWKDEIHIVNVEKQNYEYRGARYESLSEIARLITGTRWSGPLFFGLKTTPKKPGGEMRLAILGKQYVAPSTPASLPKKGWRCPSILSTRSEKPAKPSSLANEQEGWRALPTLFDDGGYSGGSMERPALKRLLEEVEKGGSIPS